MSIWELPAFHFLSLFTSSFSIWLVSVFQRIVAFHFSLQSFYSSPTWLVSISLLVIIYSFTLYFTGEFKPANCEWFTSCHNLFLLLLLDRWVSALELWAFHFLSKSIPFRSIFFFTGNYLRVVSVLFLDIIYFFCYYITGDTDNCLKIVRVLLLVSIYPFSLYTVLDWRVSAWELPAFHFLSLFSPSLSIWLVSVYLRIVAFHFSLQSFYSSYRSTLNTKANELVESSE